MPRVYELPTHLQVEDQLIAGLTIRQLLRVVVGASAAYCVWDRAPWMSSDMRLAAAGVPVIIGLLFASLQPGGRSLDQWLLAMLLFFAMPRRLAWQPGEHAPRLQLPGRDADWAELDVHPDWLAPLANGASVQLLSAAQRESQALRPFGRMASAGRQVRLILREWSA